TAGVNVMTQEGDLTTVEIPKSSFDVVMIFNYLDRKRMPEFLDAVKPGGYLIFETFMEGQQAFGWGPKSENHLLKPGEIRRLIEPFQLIFLREVIEPVDSLTAVLGSVVAQRSL
ncbi:MAG: class I SAM-dependent methyltransferase, partial [Gemmatimonadota bacterium]|nr:class I SAM-dependent methyltransferase [Gemmatimonadota bacterium]